MLIFMLYIPGLSVAIISWIEKSNYRPGIFKDGPKLDLIKSLLSASVAASLFTMLLK